MGRSRGGRRRRTQPTTTPTRRGRPRGCPFSGLRGAGGAKLRQAVVRDRFCGGACAWGVLLQRWAREVLVNTPSSSLRIHFPLRVRVRACRCPRHTPTPARGCVANLGPSTPTCARRHRPGSPVLGGGAPTPCIATIHTTPTIHIKEPIEHRRSCTNS